MDTILDLRKALVRNKAIYDENELRQWRERKLMRNEDEQLNMKNLRDSAKDGKKRMEEEEYEEKERGIAQEWRKKRLDYNMEKNNLI